MKFLCAALALFSLLLFANTIESRRSFAEFDMQKIARGGSTPLGTILAKISKSTPKEKADCHNENAKKGGLVGVEVVEEFEPRPNISAYTDDEIAKERLVGVEVVEEFEPRPNISAYTDDVSVKNQQSTKDSDHSNRKSKESFDEDFEPRPNISVYHD